MAIELGANIEAVQLSIAKAAERAGRRREDITLLGVTKTIDPWRVNALVGMGINTLGENRVQELLEKKPLVPGAVWHLIGHLQTNKARMVVGLVELIHSVDSLKLAEEISRQATRHGLTQNILIEGNIADEASKNGVPPEEAAGLARAAAELPGVCLKGLMCVAPLVTDGERNRKHFQAMKRLLGDIAAELPREAAAGFTELSMGMSNDYEEAIEEGATIVRVGTALFGGRQGLAQERRLMAR